MITNLLFGFISICFAWEIGLAILSAFKDQVINNQAINNVTSMGTSYVFITHFPTVFYLALVGVTLGIIINTLHNIGFIGWGETYKEYKEDLLEKRELNPNHKQTYKEYVQERLEAESMMK